MTFPCFILGKGSSSYTYIGVYQAEDEATGDSVTQGAQRLASTHHEWELAGVKIKLYQVLSSPTFCDLF